ncbi:hypothetical protein SteCoe_26143 [Stentor coeruleus]|uniref:Uncharacterized protein n=1 Tax=Stentor coeruleus TaxID=5963 RepID=A0A1R2BDM5_9CILI|nr:hypothetical protein SteCoe_26143 [Stentor coeruleus]
MGGVTTKIFGCYENDNPKRVLLIGEDDAGKTSLLFKLNSIEYKAEIPTIGLNLETIPYKNLKIVCHDFSVRDEYYRHWIIGKETCGIIFMIDLTSYGRFDETIDLLKEYLERPELAGLPVLVMCNKIDIEAHISIERVKEAVRPMMENRKWKVIGTAVIKNKGIKESINWIRNALADN